ncbi:MAG: poly-gamma-glutamate hydrolase family protein [Thermodesulfobacteriota bacterium]|nr:poly-gamma-glutamate hydrolase family protein [Thermodesulfobacteriota bacterium]
MAAERRDKYNSFQELKIHEKEGIDYKVLLREGISGLAVIAPHGGGIEPGTDIIADWIAGTEHSFYSFMGIKSSGNSGLHIKSEQFDEPRGIEIARASDIVLSIHGCNGNEKVIHIGGRHEELMKKIKERLNQAGFTALMSLRQELRGRKPENICNQGRSGSGVQLEISGGLRRTMFDNLKDMDGRKETDVFIRFVASLRHLF